MSRPIVMWGDPSIVADFGDGWTVSACEGGAPLLCFEFEGAAVGTAEALWFPVSSFPDIDPGAEPDTILSEFAAGFVQALEEDRTSACGTEHVFTPIPTTSFPLGDSGVAYGYQATNADGSPSELNLQYATVVGDHILSIVAAAYDEAGCPGRDDTSGFDSVSLSAVRDHLETVLAESPMPQGP